MANERITDPGSTMMDIIVKLSGGNPGAITVCAKIVKFTPEIDPDNGLGGLGLLLQLDSANIWESRIWMLYKDVCKHNLVHTLALLRANQLGMLSRSALDTAIDNYGEGVDPEAVLAQVQEMLPQFGRVSAEAIAEM